MWCFVTAHFHSRVSLRTLSWEYVFFNWRKYDESLKSAKIEFIFTIQGTREIFKPFSEQTSSRNHFFLIPLQIFDVLAVNNTSVLFYALFWCLWLSLSWFCYQLRFSFLKKRKNNVKVIGSLRFSMRPWGNPGQHPILGEDDEAVSKFEAEYCWPG